MSSENFVVYVLVGDPAIREMIEAAATRGGLSPIVLGSAGEYLRKPESGLPACLILGMQLPDMSGADLQQRLANIGPAIIFVSDRVDIGHSVRAIKAGAVDYLTTPVDPAGLARAVHDAIEVDRFRRAERARLAELVRRYRLLTAREREVFPLLTAGLLNKQVASRMGISLITVQIHRGRIMQKMEARTFAELVRFADALGISGEWTANAQRDWQRDGVLNGANIRGVRSPRVHAAESASS
ncbi:response regulator transcription factor [Steroidobacter sp. S1-65]|uniref:Response regulator transcription factor n=1 Tax=Steroidobacter gossypii TaxID=2805490 RepID=A0ABS1WV81_9GAMM|nr:LuxR C-terminal-related transcriptional regulator [Steroidobacter gossypii]MBM0104890.1 response regulator transcription factor [Steroidobacter gossypii]